MNSRLCLAAIAVIASVLSTPVPAQQPGSITTGTSPRNRATEDKYRSDEIERIKREADQPVRANPVPRFPAIKADFEQIQIINSEVLQRDAARQTPDYRQVAGAAKEIKSRATRLKTNLFSAAAEKQLTEKDVSTRPPQDMKSLLAALDDAIQRFVTNPMFTNLHVVDVQHSAKARRDLDTVIKLSKLVRKEADKLKKVAGG